MKNQLLFFLLFISTFLSGQIIQDWDLSPLGQRTYFERDNGYLEMYYNDSTEVFADYRKHYFGEKYTKDVFHGCYDEIQDFFTFDYYYSDYFYPSFEEYFAVEEWYSNDDFFYILNQNDTIKFYHKAPLNFTWKIPVIHDEFDEIKLKCVQLTEEDVFGNIDSVRVFEITTFQNNSPVNSPINLRNVKLSKTFGLLNFTPFYRWVKGYINWTDEEQFNISGFEKDDQVSGLIPEFDLFFEDYQVGDIFKWYYKSPISFPSMDSPFERWYVDSITALSFFPDSLIEITYDRKIQTNDNGSIDCDSISEEVITYRKIDFAGLLRTAPRFLFGSSSVGPSMDYNDNIWQLKSVKKNSAGKLVFDIKSWEWYDFNNCENQFTEGWKNQIYEDDLGLIYRKNNSGNGSSSKLELLGYKRDNITIGDISPICLVSSNNNTLTNEKPSFQIYPNPTSNYLNFIFPKNQNEPFSIYIYDSIGKIVLEKGNINLNPIDISKLEKGFYFVKISSSFGESIFRIAKQ